MLVSRGSSLFRSALMGLKRNQIVQSIYRSSHAWNYRTAPPPPPRYQVIAAEVAGGIMWWWILWHLWTEPEHITGEFGTFPDPSKWTDEELGIPLDDEELGVIAAE